MNLHLSPLPLLLWLTLADAVYISLQPPTKETTCHTARHNFYQLIGAHSNRPRRSPDKVGGCDHTRITLTYELLSVLISFLFSTSPLFFFLLHPSFCFSVPSLSQRHRSKGFYVMEQNNRQKCILAIRMFSVTGPEMGGQRWMARHIHSLTLNTLFQSSPLLLASPTLSHIHTLSISAA